MVVLDNIEGTRSRQRQASPLHLSLLLGALLIGLLLIIALERWKSGNSAVTDAALQLSLIDTWQAQAIDRFWTLLSIWFIVVWAAVLACRTHKTARVLIVATLGLALAVSALTLLNHSKLTERATQLSGQFFGGMFGLGLGPF